MNPGSLATAEVTVTDDDAPDPANLELSALAVTQGAETMYPVFNPRVHHYAIRCPNDATLRVTATARDASHELTLNNIPVPGMSVDKNVLVNSDHDVAIGLNGGGESVLYVVHCIPPAFPNIKITRKQAGVSDGLILFTPLRQSFPRVPAFMAIMDNNGVPRFVKDSFLATATPMNFRRHNTDLVVDGRQVQYSVTHYLGAFSFSSTASTAMPHSPAPSTYWRTGIGCSPGATCSTRLPAKVLDGCALNGHVWVFGATTTDLGYTIQVTDTATGAVREYRNEPGKPAAAITDSTAFPEGCRP